MSGSLMTKDSDKKPTPPPLPPRLPRRPVVTESPVEVEPKQNEGIISMAIGVDTYNAEIRYLANRPGCNTTSHRIFVRTNSHMDTPIIGGDSLLAFVKANIEPLATSAFLVSKIGIEEIEKRRKFLNSNLHSCFMLLCGLITLSFFFAFYDTGENSFYGIEERLWKKKYKSRANADLRFLIAP